jgi:hypothetical protein
MSWFAPQRYYGPLVLEPNHACSFEARRGDAHEFIKEDAGVRVASAFRHEFWAPPRRNSWGIEIPHASARRYSIRRAEPDMRASA